MKWVNCILIGALVIIPTFFGAFKMATEMGLSIGAIVIALFFANLDKFSKFKGAGFEAEMRNAVKETYTALEELKELALSLSAPIIDELAVSGRMLQYIPLKYKLERVEKIAKTLAKLGAQKEEIEEVCSTIYSRVHDDHVKAVLRYLKTANKDKQEVLKELEEGDVSGWNDEKLNDLIETNNMVCDDQVTETLKDFKYFSLHKKLRREDKWQS
jgi:hypothetical protein